MYDEKILAWLEEHIYLVTLWPRPAGTDLLANTYISKENITALAEASEMCWEAILNMDFEAFGKAFLASFEAQTALFPNMINKEIEAVISKYKDSVLAWKLSGAGGGGYLVLISDKPVKNAMKVKIRRWML
jgi:galactokinase/mevalonate kinase-like predicted kinase